MALTLLGQLGADADKVVWKILSRDIGLVTDGLTLDTMGICECTII